MDKLIVTGPSVLKGQVSVSSSKNASLPILAATILIPGKVSFDTLPGLSDVSFFLQILESLGAKTHKEGSLTYIDSSTVDNTIADYELVRKMRASVLVLGPLLSRFHKAKVSLPGGCSIGTRPVDIHLKGLEQMGAQIEITGGYVVAKSDGPLKGAVINLDFPSVGATENLMMAAVFAKGKTIINNAAREPEIEDLANFLIALGVNVQGAGSDSITINPIALDQVKNVENLKYKVIGDRIEAATFMVAALMCPGSEVEVLDFNPSHLQAVTDTLIAMGAKIEILERGVKVFANQKLRAHRIDTEPFPGFPTDAQAQVMTLMGVTNGESFVSENIFENRFMHVPELVRMGMNISLDGHKAVIKGIENLSAAPVMCTDLRASAALILAAMRANGESHIARIYHLDRGYERIEVKLKELGANIQRVRA